MRARVLMILTVFVFATSVANTADAPAYLAAGYKALFTCSATFLANRTPAQIAEFELSGIYRDFEPAMAKLPTAQVDVAAGAVSVTYDADKPPMVARLHRPLGCSLLSPGASPDIVLPVVAPVWSTKEKTSVAWPAGDTLDHQPAVGDAAGSRLEQISAQGFDGKTYGEHTRTSAVVIVSDGAIVGEDHGGWR